MRRTSRIAGVGGAFESGSSRPSGGSAISEHQQRLGPGALTGGTPYYLWDATLGELHRRCGNRERALAHTQRALAAAPTNPEKSLLERRMKKISEEALERK
jgi:hypothetical protein